MGAAGSGSRARRWSWRLRAGGRRGPPGPHPVLQLVEQHRRSRARLDEEDPRLSEGGEVLTEVRPGASGAPTRRVSALRGRDSMGCTSGSCATDDAVWIATAESSPI